MPGDASIREDQVSRRPTNVTLPEPLVAEARTLKVNVSQACERGLEREVRRCREKAWIEENKAAFEAWNDYVETHGLPLAEYRQF